MSKKEPLPSQIQTGYMLAKAVRKGDKYLYQALECLEQALIDTNKDGVEVENVDLGKARRLIHEARAGLQKAEEAHLLLAKLIKKGGYRKITNQDFSEYGVIGR